MRGEKPFLIIIDETLKNNLPETPVINWLKIEEWEIALKKFNQRQYRKSFTKELLQLYLSKIWFVTRAIELEKNIKNNINDNIFMWCDLGSVRKLEHENNIKFWPNKEKLLLRGLEDNKLHFYLRKQLPEFIFTAMDLDSPVAGSHIVGKTIAWDTALEDLKKITIDNFKLFGDCVYDETVYCKLLLDKKNKYAGNEATQNKDLYGSWYQTYEIDI